MSRVFSAFTLAYSLFEIPSGLARRRDRAPARPHAHRAVVVGVHDGSPGWRRACGRWWRSGSCSAPARRVRFPTRCAASRTWFPARERGMANGVLFFGSRAWRRDRRAAALLLIQQWGWRAQLRRLRRARHRVGRPLVPLVPRSPGRSSRRRRGRARVDPPGRRAAAAQERRAAHAVAALLTAAISTRSARCTSHSATGSISTSHGCRRI